MTARPWRLALAAGLVAALAVPAVASAHPGVYTVTQVVRPSGQSCQYPDDTCLTTATQYAVANDGWARGFTEDNGVTSGGLINYKKMPSGWRTPMTPEQKRTYLDAQTGLQPHATCSVANTSANILAWQGNDPFFNYVPWQKTSAGLGDEPEKWIPVVKAATGIDLSTLSGDAAFKAACENAPVSGVYHKADTGASITAALEAAITQPLNDQISTLQGQVSTSAGQVGTLQSQVSQLQNQVTTLQAAKAAADAAAATAETARQALANRPLALTLSAKRFSAPVAMVTGASGTEVTVTVQLRASAAKELKLSRTLATKKVTLGAPGAALVSPKLSSKATKAIKKHGHALKVTVQASGGGASVSSSGTLTK